jgi:hypothetical protein
LRVIVGWPSGGKADDQKNDWRKSGGEKGVNGRVEVVAKVREVVAHSSCGEIEVPRNHPGVVFLAD